MLTLSLVDPMQLIDLFIEQDTIILWCKEQGRNHYFYDPSFCPTVYLRTEDEAYARRVLLGTSITRVRKKHLVDQEIDVLKITFPSITSFKKRFSVLEHAFFGKGSFFDADIDLEEQYLYSRGLYPFCELDVVVEDGILVDFSVTSDYAACEYPLAELKTLRLYFLLDCSRTLAGITFNGLEIRTDIIPTFLSLFSRLDPDIIFIDGQQKELLVS